MYIFLVSRRHWRFFHESPGWFCQVKRLVGAYGKCPWACTQLGGDCRYIKATDQAQNKRKLQGGAPEGPHDLFVVLGDGVELAGLLWVWMEQQQQQQQDLI